MIISRIEGGLGNQMFQYAYGLYAASVHKTELKLDLSPYVGGPQHGFLLNRFAIQATAVDDAERANIPLQYRNSGDRQNAKLGILDRATSFFGVGSQLKRVKEKPFGFQNKYLQVADGSYLVGNWQSERFFRGVEADLRNHFQLRTTPGSESQEVAQRIAGCRSLALHIRRGDYLTNSSAAAIYEHLSLDYYRACADRFAGEGPELQVFVFSNDIPWCQEKLNLPWKTHYVGHNTAETAHEDMWLISLAAGVAIANSTFSWWAAWLNRRNHAKIYAPSQWFRPGTLNAGSILCESWSQVADPSLKKSEFGYGEAA